MKATRRMVPMQLLVLQLLPATAAAQAQWQSARVHIAASMDRVVAALETPCRVLLWMPDLETVERLEDQGNGRSLVYMRSHAPWPFAPRDAVLAFTRENQPDRVLITMQARPTARPLVPGYVRIPASEGHWSLSRDNGTTLVVYRSRVVPGGQVPQWLSDRFARRSVERAVNALRDHVLEYDTETLPAGCAAGDHSRVRPGN